MAKRIFVGHHKVTNEKVYRIDIEKGNMTQYQTQSGKLVANTEVILKEQ